MNRILCAHCGRDLLPNPRVKNQRYCNRPECQRVRKALWQRHPEYWLQYRQRHPQVRERNRLLQRVRNTKRSVTRRGNMDMIANMGAITHCFSYKPGPYYLVPPIANMDAIPQKVFIIPSP